MRWEGGGKKGRPGVRASERPMEESVAPSDRRVA
jgi:hypothetical protein